MNRLSTTSRILVAFLTGALIAVFFLPAWRIDLYAPQYPEGLTMFIWTNTLSGDVDIINGLNHYIGMKPITVDMFPEFKFLSYIVLFFMLFGMMVSFTGRRKLLLYYLILTVIGALLVLYDLYRWGYKYGHDLDPTAPIQVAGLSYQPPVIGHKRLLNFDAYSYPAIGGWIVIGAGILAGIIWLVEWKKHRKLSLTKTKNITASLSIVSIVLLMLTSCSLKPEPFVAGQDECHICKMGVADFRFGGEVITKKGKIYKFDDTGCMIDFLNSGNVQEKEIALRVIMNYEKPNEFINVNDAWFLVSPTLKSPMNSNAAGFTNIVAAEKINESKPGEIIKWNELFQLLKR
jgi:copper chaperone NosL